LHAIKTKAKMNVTVLQNARENQFPFIGGLVCTSKHKFPEGLIYPLPLQEVFVLQWLKNTFRKITNWTWQNKWFVYFHYRNV